MSSRYGARGGRYRAPEIHTPRATVFAEGRPPAASFALVLVSILSPVSTPSVAAINERRLRLDGRTKGLGLCNRVNSPRPTDNVPLRHICLWATVLEGSVCPGFIGHCEPGAALVGCDTCRFWDSFMLNQMSSDQTKRVALLETVHWCVCFLLCMEVGPWSVYGRTSVRAIALLLMMTKLP